jgi:AcrR family transcriptional regulator
MAACSHDRTEESDLSAEASTEPSQPSRRERRRAETRERIFEAAIRLLSERDFDMVTVEMITEAADVGKGTFFNYFDNKEAVVGYLFETQLRLLKETLQAASAGFPLAEWPEGSRFCTAVGSPHWRKMMAIVHRVTEQREKNKRLTRTLLALSLTNPHVRIANLLFRKRILEVIRGLVEEGQAQGELRRDLSADALAEHMYSAHISAIYVWSQSEEEDSLHEAIDRTYARLWDGVRHYEPPHRSQQE